MESWRTRLARWSEEPDTSVRLRGFPPSTQSGVGTPDLVEFAYTKTWQLCATGGE